jgi:hypothetical protein
VRAANGDKSFVIKRFHPLGPFAAFRFHNMRIAANSEEVQSCRLTEVPQSNTGFSSEDGWRDACASRRRDRRLRLLQALVMWATGAISPRRPVAAFWPLTICPFGHMLFP